MLTIRAAARTCLRRALVKVHLRVGRVQPHVGRPGAGAGAGKLPGAASRGVRLQVAAHHRRQPQRVLCRVNGAAAGLQAAGSTE